MIFVPKDVEPWGLTVDWNYLTIAKVEEGKQGDKNGVKKDWILLKVNGQALQGERYEELKNILKTGQTCSVLFGIPQSRSVTYLIAVIHTLYQ